MKMSLRVIAGLALAEVLAWGWQTPIKQPNVAIDRAEAFAAYLAIFERAEARIAAMRDSKTLTAEIENELVAQTGLNAAEFTKLAVPIKQHRKSLIGLSARMDQVVSTSAKPDATAAQLQLLQMERARGIDAAMAEVFEKASPASRKAIEQFLAVPYRRLQ